MLKSSFNHYLSGDSISGSYNKLVYFALYLINFTISSVIFLPLRILSSSLFKHHTYSILSSREDLAKIFNIQANEISESRLLCFEFLADFFEKSIGKDKSNQHIRILDLGCGSGRFYKIFDYFGDKLGYTFDYTGIDIYENKEIDNLRINQNFNFFKVDAVSFLKSNTTKFDLILSQSVLEHIKYDTMVMDELQGSKYEDSKQIHFIPGLLSFFGYIFHGFRHYSVFNIFCLLRFSHRWNIYPIGNFKLSLIHFFRRFGSKSKFKVNLESRDKYLSNNFVFPIFYVLTKNE